MTLSDRLTAVIQAIAADIKALRAGGAGLPAATSADYGRLLMVWTDGSYKLTSGLTVTGAGAVQTTGVGNGAVNGGVRGAASVDLQSQRALAAQVASGSWAGVLSGANNKATADYGVVSGGHTNSTTATYATVAGGFTNTAGGSYAVVGGGQNNTANGSGTIAGGSYNTASGIASAIVGGSRNTASGNYSTALGYYASATRYGQVAHGSGSFGTAGLGQRSDYVLTAATTNATATVMTLDGSAPGSGNRLALNNNQTLGFSGLLTARDSSGSNVGAWELKGLVSRGATAATTTLGNSSAATQVSYLGTGSNWTVSLGGDTTNGALTVTVTGAASTNIRWVLALRTSEVTY